MIVLGIDPGYALMGWGVVEAEGSRMKLINYGCIETNAAAEYTQNLYEYTPMQIKQAITGYGKADKKQIQQMVKLLLKLEEIPKPDDAADAIACAITHCQAGVAKSQFMMK